MNPRKDVPAMPLMTWTSRMSVGVSALDEDHKKIVDLLNELHDGLVAGHCNREVGAVLDRLAIYTQTHFGREEYLFAQTHYAEAVPHAREHAELIRRVQDLRARYAKGDYATLSLEAIHLLKEWLFSHIQGSDKRYQNHFNSCGIQ